jgi:hypothetical protein
MWVWHVASSFPRKNTNFKTFEKCWGEYILSKRRSNRRLGNITHVNRFKIHILLLIFLGWLTRLRLYGHAAHVWERRKEYNIIVRKIQEKKPIKKWTVNYNIILKFILEELGVNLFSRFKHFRTWSSCRINPSFHLMTRNIFKPWGFLRALQSSYEKWLLATSGQTCWPSLCMEHNETDRKDFRKIS